MRQESISMKMKEVVSTMVRGGIPAALLLWSVQCMAFRRPSQTRPRVDVSVQQNVFSPTTMDTTVDVTIIKELPPPKYALWDGVETALRHLQLRGVPLTFDNVNEELYVMHKNNDIHLPYDPYWSGKMKRPLTKKKREKALFEEQLRKRLAVVNQAIEQSEGTANPVPMPSQYRSKDAFVRAYVTYKMENADDEVRARYKKKIGGMNDYRRDMQSEAIRTWNETRRR